MTAIDGGAPTFRSALRGRDFRLLLAGHGIGTVAQLALTLAVGIGGLSANGAAAGVAQEIPVNVTAEATTDFEGTGTVVVHWDAPIAPDSIYRIDVDLDGQDGNACLQQQPLADAAEDGLADGGAPFHPDDES